MARVVKKKEYEKLTKENIQKVILLLNPEDGKPISKKEACEILNISYNTTRLEKILSEFKEDQEREAKRRAANRGKPASPAEIQTVITEFLREESVASIAKRLCRSSGFINSILEKVGVPDKKSRELPEQCVSDSFEKGERVWSAFYGTVAIIKEELSTDYVAKMPGLSKINYEEKYGCKCYAIYVLKQVNGEDSFFPGVTSGGFFAYAPAYELGSLKHLSALGVDLSRI